MPNRIDIVPYIGGHFRYAYADYEVGGNGKGYIYGPLAGIKFFLNPRANIFVELQYRLYGGDLDDIYDESTAVMFGLSFKWG